MRYRAPRGTADVLPDRSAAYQRILEAFREECLLSGYGEIVTPLIESAELFTRSIGESSDIVEKEMYVFPDKAGRSLALRPEGTAPIVRAFVEHKMQGWASPLKLFYSGPMFRYERPQAGRMRQFTQCGTEVLGSDDPAVDAEVIAVAARFYRKVGLTHVEMRLGSIGCAECRPAYAARLKAYAEKRSEELCDDCRRRLVRNPMRLLDCKVEACRVVLEEGPRMFGYLCPACLKHLESVEGFLDAAQLEYHLDDGLARGFDYYTKTVFEFIARGIGAQDALGGGGRYNQLVSSVGGPDTPGVGFAAGVERILIAVGQQGADTQGQSSPLCYVVPLGDAARRIGFSLLEALRAIGVRAEYGFDHRGIKSQLRSADKLGARYAAIIGDQELLKEQVRLRDMESGEEESLPNSEAVKVISRYVGLSLDTA